MAEDLLMREQWCRTSYNSQHLASGLHLSATNNNVCSFHLRENGLITSRGILLFLLFINDDRDSFAGLTFDSLFFRIATDYYYTNSQSSSLRLSHFLLLTSVLNEHRLHFWEFFSQLSFFRLAFDLDATALEPSSFARARLRIYNYLFLLPRRKQKSLVGRSGEKQRSCDTLNAFSN